MKIALQLFGHMRTFDKCYDSLFENFLSLYDVDIFIHTWDTIDHNSKSWHNAPKVEKIYDDKLDFEKIVRKIYKPKVIKIEHQNLFSEEGLYGTGERKNISNAGLRYMHYSKYSCNKLRMEYQRQNSLSYDYVVVTRPDILLNEPLKLDEFKKEFDFNPKISLHFVHDVKTVFFNDRAIQIPLVGDLFYVLKPEAADLLENSFKGFDIFFKDMMKTMPKGLTYPEVSFLESLRSINIFPIFYRYDFTVKRTLGKYDLNHSKRRKKQRYKKRILACTMVVIAAVVGNFFLVYFD